MSKSYWVQVVLSLVVIVGGSVVALNKEDPQIRNPAMAAVGLVIGYWFKSPVDQENRGNDETKD